YTYSGAYAVAYPTSVCNALNQCVTYIYDFNTGLVSSSTDANNQPTTYAYDSLLRPTQTILADGGQTTSSYPSATEADRSVKINASLSQQSKVYFDGLGRVNSTVQVTPGGNATVSTTYDAMGRVASVSNPYFS